jgi:hypothetical protein
VASPLHNHPGGVSRPTPDTVALEDLQRPQLRLVGPSDPIDQREAWSRSLASRSSADERCSFLAADVEVDPCVAADRSPHAWRRRVGRLHRPASSLAH